MRNRALLLGVAATSMGLAAQAAAHIEGSPTAEVLRAKQQRAAQIRRGHQLKKGKPTKAQKKAAKRARTYERVQRRIFDAQWPEPVAEFCPEPGQT